jgi:hypothetical protein
MIRFLFPIGFSILLISSCTKEKRTDGNDDIAITMGTMCGWCAGDDSLLITKYKTHFRFINPCDSKGYIKDTLTDLKEWNTLIGKLDLDKFQKININTCNICVDGCDTWISINNNTISHTIRFGNIDSALVTIKPFVDKLDSIMLSFRK